MSESSFSFCYRSNKHVNANDRGHKWEYDHRRKTNDAIYWFWLCEWCQVVKYKALRFKVESDGQVKNYCVEYFPPGQRTNELDPNAPLSESEEYTVK